MATGQIHPQTETAVANEALSALHVPAIADLVADTSEVGETLRVNFAGVRDAMLRQCAPNFAEREAILNLDPDAPASVRFKYAYVLPNNPRCLKALRLWGCHERDWKLEGNRLLANHGPTATLIFTALIDDVAQWDALFRKAFGLALALSCKKLCRDEDTIAELKQAAADALAELLPADASEGVPDEMPEPNVIAWRNW